MRCRGWVDLDVDDVGAGDQLLVTKMSEIQKKLRTEQSKGIADVGGVSGMQPAWGKVRLHASLKIAALTDSTWPRQYRTVNQAIKGWTIMISAHNWCEQRGTGLEERPQTKDAASA